MDDDSRADAGLSGELRAADDVSLVADLGVNLLRRGGEEYDVALGVNVRAQHSRTRAAGKHAWPLRLD